MSFSQSPDTPFIHVHVAYEGELYCTWYAFSEEDGAWLDQCVLAAEAVATDELIHTCNRLTIS